MKKVAVGFDIGGHNIRGAAVNSDGEVLFREAQKTPEGRSPGDVLDTVEKVYKAIEAKIGSSKVSGLGFGFPGFLDSHRGVILKSPNFPAWDDFHLRAALQKKFSGNFEMDNDANCAALGEAWLGSSSGVKNSILVTLGTGVGGGIIIDGRLLRGAHGAAAEIGHMPVEPDGPACGCGGNGCLERLVSGDSIRKDTGRGVQEWGDLARKKDAQALKVFERMGRYLGIAFASLCQIFDPEILVFGGRISLAFDLFSPALEKELRKRIGKHPSQNVKLNPARLSDDAGLLGAVSLVFSRS